MYLTPTENHFACDIEANGLYDEVTKVWCVTVLNVITKEESAFLSAEEFRAWHTNNPEAIFVGHNFLAYDAPVLNRLWGMRISASKVVDTFLLSQLYEPNRPLTQHGLRHWGERLRYPKGEFDEFDHYSEEMLTYCRRDTRLTALLFRKLSERMRQTKFSEKGVELEHQAWNIIQNKQLRNGFPFDLRKAQDLYATLRSREEELKDEIYKLWPPTLELVHTGASAFRKNGEPSHYFALHSGQYPKIELGPEPLEGKNRTYLCYDWVSFNLGSPIQRINKLLDLGWEPANRTKLGSPKVDEEELLAFAEISGQKEVNALAKWVVIYSRANMVNTWLDAYNEKTKAIHGRLFIASTLRYKHSQPNSANIPSVRTGKDASGDEHVLFGEEGMYTYECRDLWTCGGDEWTLVGLDGTGIQNRCLIHNLIKLVGEEVVAPFKELALSGDVHKRNIEVLGLANKPAAKKFYYTLMMGGGGARLAADQVQFGTHMTAAEGEAKKAALIESIPGFHDLIKKLKNDLEKYGRITLCDDTPILVPSPHMVIPYLLQGDESRLMKQSLVFLDAEVRGRRHSKHVFKAADIHDEWQYRIRTEVVPEFLSYALPCFNRAGEEFNYLIPIDGDAKTGRTWAETH